MSTEMATKWDDRYYLEVFDLARRGLSDEAIAEELGVRLHQLRRWMRTNEALRAAVIRGREEQDEFANELELDLSGLLVTQRRFLLALSKVGTLSAAARASGINRVHHYNWLERHEEYAKQHAIAIAIYTEHMEEEAARRAIDGQRRYKFYKGEPVMMKCSPGDPEAIKVEDDEGNTHYVKHYYENEKSDLLMMFMLKSKKPEVYRDNFTFQQNNTQNVFNLNEVVKMAEQKGNVLQVETIDAVIVKAIEDHRNSIEEEEESE